MLPTTTQLQIPSFLVYRSTVRTPLHCQLSIRTCFPTFWVVVSGFRTWIKLNVDCEFCVPQQALRTVLEFPVTYRFLLSYWRKGGWNSAVGMATRYGIDGLWFEFLWKWNIFLFFRTSISPVGACRVSSSQVKWPGLALTTHLYPSLLSPEVQYW